MHIPLPTSVNSADTSPEAQRLRLVIPSFRSGPFSLPWPAADTIAIGAHRIALMPGWETMESRVGEAFVLFAAKHRSTELAVLVDTDDGPRQVLGHSREFIDAVRLQKFARTIETVPVESATPTGTVALTDDDDARAEADRIVSLAAELTTTSEPTTPESDRLAAAINDLDGKSYSEPETAETRRLVQLAATLDDGDEIGDAEVARLAALGDSLSDG